MSHADVATTQATTIANDYVCQWKYIAIHSLIIISYELL